MEHLHRDEVVDSEGGTQSNSEKQASRRKVLKLMAMTGGAIVTTQFMPGEWIKPVINIGTLPAHAQGSAQPLTSTTILGLWNLDGPNPDGSRFFGTATFNADGTVDFTDDTGNPDGSTNWSLSGSTLTIPGEGDFTISGNSLRFTATSVNDGTTTIFTRP